MTDPDVVRKHARVSRSYKESHGYYAEFEEEEKCSVLAVVLCVVVVFGSFAVLLYVSL